MTESNPNAHPLTGMGVLEFNENGPNRQGVILGACEGKAIVQLFSWVMGDPTNIAMVPIPMLGDFDWRQGETGWLLFASSEARSEYWKSRVAPWQKQREKDRKI